MIYFDNAATTKPAKTVAETVYKCLEDNFGNPSSLHALGLKAEQTMTAARKNIADALGVPAETVYFTSGATESSNLAVRGAAGTYGRRKKKVITTTVEHSSVKEAFNRLEEEGFEVIRISPRDGAFDPADFIRAADESTCLISMMLVNNETGAVLPVKKVFTEIKRRFPDIITHCDAVQAFMKIPVKPNDLKADLISMSAHKIYGPKGVGALYVKKGVRLLKQNLGGRQENNMRGGTEAVPLIAGFGEAVSLLAGTMAERTEKLEALRKYLTEKISAMDGVVLNSREDAVPYIVNISVKGIRSEIILHFLEEKEIYISSGSACSKGAKSGVLGEFGIRPELEDSALRISFCHENTEAEIDEFINALEEAQKRLRR
ncbi:cysteine desulfurase family protein [Ruminococcus sp. HUN007]|uniref:cysteine desulfurase family protein n=1 Tax=Ruminococcus sp. HUN007 TaxID=1514668 RepID=UPI0005D1DDF2|nr:cysteine desulfurase family protein [Ruminococcus sp. HUN007]